MKRACLASMCVVSLAVVSIVGAGQSREAATPESESAVGHDTCVEVELATATFRTVEVELRLAGTILPRRRTTIVSEVDGVILNLAGTKESFDGTGLQLGQPVSEGEVLARLAADDFQRGLDVAQARLDRSKRELDELLAWMRPEEIEQLTARRDGVAVRLQVALAELRRAETLLGRSAVSRFDYERVEAQAAEIRAELTEAEAALQMAKAGPTSQAVAVAKARVDESQAECDLAAQLLDKTVIRAPYDGVITGRFVDPGQRVTAHPPTPILEMIDSQVVFAEVHVSERWLGLMHIGDEAQIEAHGVLRPLIGRITAVNQMVDRATRTFQVRVVVQNGDEQLKPGQFAHVNLRAGSKDPALSIPTAAVRYNDGQPSVLVYSDGDVHERQVEVGRSNDDFVTILAGMTAGDQVVVGDHTGLTDGMPVRPLQNETILSKRGRR